jgi:hypothetical protein
MPHNGAAAALPSEVEPFPVPWSGAPAQPPAEIERRIGETVADAVLAVCAGIAGWETAGGLTSATRARAGDLFVALYELQESTPTIDFDSTARREARRVLMQRYGTALLQRFGATTDTRLGELIDIPLNVLARVTASERARASALLPLN